MLCFACLVFWGSCFVTLIGCCSVRLCLRVLFVVSRQRSRQRLLFFVSPANGDTHFVRFLLDRVLFHPLSNCNLIRFLLLLSSALSGLRFAGLSPVLLPISGSFGIFSDSIGPRPLVCLPFRRIPAARSCHLLMFRLIFYFVQFVDCTFCFILAAPLLCFYRERQLIPCLNLFASFSTKFYFLQLIMIFPQPDDISLQRTLL